jgi:hypothetical protein
VAAALVVVGVGGALLSAVMIAPGLELVSQSLRRDLNGASIDIGYFQVDSLMTLVQPDFYGLLSDNYTGPRDKTQHYFYAGIALVPLALIGVRNTRVLRAAVLLALPFLWYAAGPAGYAFGVVSQLPGFHSVELPMNGWFLPALGLALLGGAGVTVVEPRLRWWWLGVPVLVVMFVDVLQFNELQNPLAFARRSFEELYAAPIRSFEAQLDAARPPVARLYGPPATAIGYRNHALQSHIETTYGYNPLELEGYAAYADAAETNPRLVDGLAASHRLEVGAGGEVTLQADRHALPLAFFARRLVSMPNAASVRASLFELDPAEATVVVGPLPTALYDPSASVTVSDRGEDRATLHYRSASPNLLRIAIPSYPGWRATLDGVDLPTLSVDGALLGVVVPAGEGDLRLWYSPRLFWPGVATSGLALAAWIGLVSVAVLRRRRCGAARR